MNDTDRRLDAILETPRLKDHIARNTRDAVFLKRRLPRGEALTFLGGTPIMPRELRWPVDSRSGYAMTFLAQVHLPDLPADRMPEMPRSGILYCFASPSGPESSTVLHAAETGDLAPAEPEAPELAHCSAEGNSVTGGNSKTFETADFTPFPFSRFPKYEVDLIGGQSVLGMDWEFAMAEGWNEDDACDAIDGLSVLRDRLRAEAEQAFYGSEVHARRQQRLERAHGLDTGHACWLRGGPNGQPPSALAADWPQSWLFVAPIFNGFFRRNTMSGDFHDHAAGRPDVRDEFLAECRQWLDRAAENGAFVPLSDAVRQEFRDWIARWFKRASEESDAAREAAKTRPPGGQITKLLSKLVSGGGTARTADPNRIWSEIRYHLNFSDGVLRAATRCLSADQPDNGLLSPSAIDDLLPTFEVPHQMFGHGRIAQSAALERSHQALLLQLEDDENMGFSFGDVGVLQIWIDHADLAAGRFDQTELTVEGS